MEEETKVISKENIKIARNTKNVTWEVKSFIELTTPEKEEALKQTIAYLQKADQMLIETFGIPGVSK